MSLFKTKEWWRTEFNTNERFYNQKLLVASLLSFQTEDVIIISNSKGVLKIYNILPRWKEMKFPISYTSNDLIIETQLPDSIMDLKAGKFVSGSQKCYLAVLMPNKLSIFDINFKEESSSLGAKYCLEVKYERQLSSNSMSLTTGPFGRVSDKDLLCIQFADGSLLFLDQDLNSFTQILQCRLQHEPLLYLEANDIFITQNSDWVLSFYKYQNIVEFGKNLNQKAKSAKLIEPDYKYNLGETLLAVNCVKLSSIATGIVIVSEKGLYIFHDVNLSLKQAKRISFNVLCIHTYIVEPDGKLLLMLVTDTKTVKVYENLSLKWSAEVAFTPAAVSIVRSQEINGLIVMLSEDGNLEIGYLGSHPSLNIAPSINRKRYNYVDAEKQLLHLRTEIKNSLVHGSSKNISASFDSCLQLNLDKKHDAATKKVSTVTMRNDDSNVEFSIDINLNSNIVVNNIQLYVDVLKPWRLEQDNLILISLNFVCDYPLTEFTRPVSIQLAQEEHSVTLSRNLLLTQVELNSDDELLMLFFTSYLINKISEKFTRSFRTSIEPSKIYFLMEYLQIYWEARHNVKKIKNELTLLMQQLRSIIKKIMLSKDRNHLSSTNTKLLICYKMICQSIIQQIDLFAKHEEECSIAADNFYSVLRIILNLLRINTPIDLWSKLDSAVCFQLQAENCATWEETTKYSIGTFLQESLPKIIKGSHCVSAEKFYSLQDVINIGDNFLHIIDKVHENRLNINSN
ncbi:protein PTHB1 isoform X2 [Leptopilina heterotoma]|uniref:protein PTHB1 isoform X2 n=1 Tax=Leptopilina heterotoma TaxID=63436 RepID=UPI001CA7FECC|nr:protein PTHB1 isoform X2 [Leptopilina heterotoma]